MEAEAPISKRPSCILWSEIEKWTPESVLLRFGKLPDGWRLLPVSAFAAQLLNKEKVKPESEYRMAGVRWYGEGVFHRETVVGKEQSANYLYALKPGAIIYNRLFAWKESFAVVPDELEGFYVSNEFPQFEIDEAIILPKYIYLLFNTQKIIGAVNAASIGSAAISRNRFKEPDFLGFKVPIPPMPTQQKIVAHWEDAQKKASDLLVRAEQLPDELEKQVLEALGLKKKKRTAMPKVMVTNWADLTKWNQRATYLLRQTPDLSNGIHPIVSGCECIAEVKHGCSASPSSKPTTLRVLKLSAVTSGQFRPSEAKFIADKKQFRESFDLCKGDILMCRTNGTLAYVGRPAILDKDYPDLIFPDKLMRVRCKANVLPEFLEYILSSSIARPQLEANARTAVGNHAIGNEDVFNVELPLPPLFEQENLIKIIQEAGNKSGRAREEAMSLKRTAEKENEKMILGIRPVDVH